MPLVYRPTAASRQTRHGQSVLFAAEILLQGVPEYLPILSRVCEEREAGAEFQVIRVAQDFADRPPLDRQNKSHAFTEACAKRRIRQIRGRFFKRGDRIALCRWAMAQPRDVRKD